MPSARDGFKLIGAVLDRALLVGGWDLARAEPRPFRRAVPAGAVYYFHTQADAAAIAGELRLTAMGEDTDMGFGLVLAGGW